jgi:Tfp pilus assembly protein PilW
MNVIEQKGLSLVEVVIYVGIFSIVISGITSFMLFSVQSRAKNQIVTEVEQQGMQVMNIITQAVRNGEGINSPTPGSSSGSLSIDMPDAGVDPTVFDLSSSVIRISEAGGGAIDLTSSQVNVTNLLFENNTIPSTDDTIKIEYTLEYNNTGDATRFDYSKTFYGSATQRW